MSEWTPERIAKWRNLSAIGALTCLDELPDALDEIERLQARVAELARLLQVASAFEERLCVRDQRRERLLRECLDMDSRATMRSGGASDD